MIFCLKKIHRHYSLYEKMAKQTLLLIIKKRLFHGFFENSSGKRIFGYYPNNCILKKYYYINH